MKAITLPGVITATAVYRKSNAITTPLQAICALWCDALQILGETLRVARLRIKELEAETNIQTTELNRLKEYVNASESAGRTMYGQQVDELKQVST